ncbi:MAG: lipopolysaccharide assembly protein LapB [Coxiellaceae bacterium]|jgi:lipopolysaccharide biosynthesis regulator YciM|nr:lipopolysaccharide assembly protein LapB [Coxiellaceae bacterium]
MLQLLLLLLPIAAISGWFAGWRYRKSVEVRSEGNFIPPGYFLGLNYLINDQPDKAVDVFIKMLEVNTDTVETHLALGNLFRRRGEVDRAIRIHQNLIARPQLVQKQRMQALLELARDYLRAGVFDRAERLFLELIKLDGDIHLSLNSLINIYQQQKDWHQAITTAKKLESVSHVNMHNAIAHYYCELADQARLSNESQQAYKYLDNALNTDINCARANIILGQLYFAEGYYEQAIKASQMVYNQDAEYVSEVIDLLGKSYKQIGKEEEYIAYLVERIAEKPRIYYVLAMAEHLVAKQGDMVALAYLAHQMPKCLSLRGLERMLDLYINHVDISMKEQILLLKEFITQLFKNKPIYRCVHCGFAGKNLYWQCPSCRWWNSVKPIHGLEGD